MNGMKYAVDESLPWMKTALVSEARLVSMLLRLITLGLIVAALSISTDGVVIVVLLFVLVVPFEKLFPRHKGSEGAPTLPGHRHRLCLGLSLDGVADGGGGLCHRSVESCLDSRAALGAICCQNS